MTTALIVVDVQKDFVTGGSLPVDGGLSVAREISKNLHLWKNTYDYVVATKDWHISPGKHWSDDPDFISSWPKHCEAGTIGSDFAGHLFEDNDFDNIFKKGHYSGAYSGFEGEDDSGELLEDWLRGRNVDTIVVVGIALDQCVSATAVSGVQLGFNVQVLLNYTVPMLRDNTSRVIDILKQTGVATSRDVW